MKEKKGTRNKGKRKQENVWKDVKKEKEMRLKIKEIGNNLRLWVQVWNGQRDAHMLSQNSVL